MTRRRCCCGRPLVATAREGRSILRPRRWADGCSGLGVGGWLRLPFAAGAFDATVATNLLFLLPDPAAGIAALARVTRAGGMVAFVNPSEAMSTAAAEAFAAQRGLEGFAGFSFVNYGRLAEAHHRLSAAQWSALAESAGLTEVEPRRVPAGWWCLCGRWSDAGRGTGTRGRGGGERCLCR